MKKYGLIGEKLGHSFSPQIHGLLQDYEYRLYEVERDTLSRFMNETDLQGFNVTIPYKQEVIPFCKTLSDRAAAIGSVNTVVRMKDGSFFGDNTDYFGFEYMLKKSGVSVSGKKAIVLGSGGASKTVQAVLKANNASSVTVVSRTGENNYGNLQLHKDAVVIVNTTPLGMYPNTGVSPVDLTSFPDCRLVLDLIYNPDKTALILQAKSLGIPAFSGLSMLVAQAKEASDIFTSTRSSDDVIASIEKTILSQTMNIALIGMPGCGKTTVGKLLAEMTDREFIDLDEEIEKALGRSIPDVIASEGLEYFRNTETAVLRKISCQSGKVIATGGGVVTIPENKPLLAQNSITVLLERPLKDLESKGRPLSQSKGVEALYNERKDLYQEWSELKIANISPKQTAKEIKEKLFHF
ncbi:MAG: shikimate kinase [Firmicutes bacterium]|nr:shikimate kinase [Bacillota bacterium]